MASTQIFQLAALKILDRQTKKVLHRGRVTGNFSYSITPEIMQQNTGSSFYPIEAEVSTIAGEATMSINEYDSSLLKLVAPSSAVVNAVTAGLVSDVKNIGSASIFGTSSPVTAIAITTGATVKSGYYRLEATDVATKKFNLIAITSTDLISSDYSDFPNDIVEEVTFTTASTALSIGVTLTNITTALTGVSDGDAITFRVFKPGAESHTQSIGENSVFFNHYQINALSRKIGDGRWTELELYRCLISGPAFMFGTEFSTSELQVRTLFDENEGTVGRFIDFKEFV